MDISESQKEANRLREVRILKAFKKTSTKRYKGIESIDALHLVIFKEGYEAGRKHECTDWETLSSEPYEAQ